MGVAAQIGDGSDRMMRFKLHVAPGRDAVQRQGPTLPAAAGPLGGGPVFMGLGSVPLPQGLLGQLPTAHACDTLGAVLAEGRQQVIGRLLSAQPKRLVQEPPLRRRRAVQVGEKEGEGKYSAGQPRGCRGSGRAVRHRLAVPTDADEDHGSLDQEPRQHCGNSYLFGT
jgi:hypothetical protein